jgi:pimeloyl-ACP methyl ester carboxylesterase
MPSFRHEGNRISYQVQGSGDRPLVLIHGLLMSRRMFDKLAPEMAARGNRVLCIDLLGHGESDRPSDMRRYSMPFFAEQVVALLDHLEVDRAVVGGTSLGANVTLEVAALAPDRLQGMFVEMPVLDDALLAAALAFTPIMAALRLGRPVIKAVAAGTSRIPRTNYLVDMGLDWLRRDPEPSEAVLEGLFFGRTAPHSDVRKTFQQPALIVGHPSDPLHPFSDADTLAAEMPNARLVNANSILEWRIWPDRLDDELARFLDDVWKPKPAARKPRSRSRAKASTNSGRSRARKRSGTR